MADYYHLIDTVLPDLFGKYYPLLKETLLQMANSLTRKKFEVARQNGQSLLEGMSPRNGATEKEFYQFSQERSTYAQYILRETKGTQGRRGSTASKQNHSSVLCHLNDGICSENKYCEEPVTLIRDIFDRQKYHTNKWNSQL